MPFVKSVQVCRGGNDSGKKPSEVSEAARLPGSSGGGPRPLIPETAAETLSEQSRAEAHGRLSPL